MTRWCAPVLALADVEDAANVVDVEDVDLLVQDDAEDCVVGAVGGWHHVLDGGEEPAHRDHGNEVFLPNTKREMRMKEELSKEEEELAEMVAIKDDDIYPLAGKRMGKCILLENDMFHTGLGLSKRKGSSVDRALIID